MPKKSVSDQVKDLSEEAKSLREYKQGMRNQLRRMRKGEELVRQALDALEKLENPQGQESAPAKEAKAEVGVSDFERAICDYYGIKTKDEKERWLRIQLNENNKKYYIKQLESATISQTGRTGSVRTEGGNGPHGGNP